MTSRFIEVGAPEDCPYFKFCYPDGSFFPVHICMLKCKNKFINTTSIYSDAVVCYSYHRKEFSYDCPLKEMF